MNKLDREFEDELNLMLSKYIGEEITDEIKDAIYEDVTAMLLQYGRVFK